MQGERPCMTPPSKGDIRLHLFWMKARDAISPFEGVPKGRGMFFRPFT
jgi:hypothetical protein